MIQNLFHEFTTIVFPSIWAFLNSSIVKFVPFSNANTFVDKRKKIIIKNFFIYCFIIFSGIIPFGRYLIINNNPIPIIKNLKYGTLSIRCCLNAFVSGKPDVKK